MVNLNREKGSKNVLLHSAVLWIENIENSNYCTDRTVLFNTGSQRSFLTEPVRKKLKLPALRKETMIFQVFGQNDNKVKEVNIVQIKIKGFRCLLKLFHVQKYAHLSQIISITLLKTIDHLRNIKLSKHSEENSASIDLLI